MIGEHLEPRDLAPLVGSSTRYLHLLFHNMYDKFFVLEPVPEPEAEDDDESDFANNNGDEGMVRRLQI